MRKKPDYYFGKAKRMLKKEKWSNEKNKWLTLVNCLEDKLRKLNDNNLQKEKLEAQANLKYCELRNENVILKYGLPIASFFSSIATLLIALFEDNAVPNAKCIAIVLSSFFIAVAILYIIGEWCRNSRVKEIIYYQIKLRIIEIIENEKKLLSKCDVNTSNKTTKCYIVEIIETKSSIKENDNYAKI